MPLFKPIVAMPGDIVQVASEGIRVNGKMLINSQSQTIDQHGRPMTPMQEGLYKVEQGTVWLVSQHNPKSFDSRYFGPVPIGHIAGTMQPVWVEK